MPAAANGQPAFAVYAREGEGRYAAHSVQVLAVAGGRVMRIVNFPDPGLFPAFGLPAVRAGAQPASGPEAKAVSNAVCGGS